MHPPTETKPRVRAQTSASVEIKPQDPLCRYWAEIVRAGEHLPLPRAVVGGNDLPGPYSLYLLTIYAGVWGIPPFELMEACREHFGTSP